MKNLLIKIKELKTKNYSRKDDSCDVIINFNVNDEPETITKRFRMNQRPEALGHELVEHVKNYVKDKYKPSITDDFLEGIIVVRYDDLEEIEEKVAGFFKNLMITLKGIKLKCMVKDF